MPEAPPPGDAGSLRLSTIDQLYTWALGVLVLLAVAWFIVAGIHALWPLSGWVLYALVFWTVVDWLARRWWRARKVGRWRAGTRAGGGA